MSTTVCGNKMEYSISNIREQLRVYEGDLENDNYVFHQKLNSTRNTLFDYIDQFIELLNNIKIDYTADFVYLEEENRKTSEDNKQRFNELCKSINQHENDQRKLLKIFNEFKEIFPMRPNMLQNIPEFDLPDINIEDFIKRKDKTTSTAFDLTTHTLMNNNDSFFTVTKADHASSPIIFNEQSSIEEDKSSEQNHRYNQYEKCEPSNSSSVAESSFVPIRSVINDDAQPPYTSSTITGSIGRSYHRQFASENNPTTTMNEPQSRSVSTASTTTGSDNMVEILFKVFYQSNRHPYLMAYNTDENCLLIYSLNTRKLEYLYIPTRQITSIHLPNDEPLLSLGYSSSYHRFYLITKQTNYFVLFRLNEQRIEVEKEVKLTDENEKINHLIAGHMYQNDLLFIYKLSSELVRFGKYNFEESTFMPSINLENIIYDDQQQFSYDIIDFTVNSSYITLLIRLKNVNKYMLVVHDHDIHQINSFDLIDAKEPLSIVSTITTSQSAAATTTTCNEQIQLLIFINDPRSHIIHCCSHEQYLTLMDINSFGICSLNDGNLALVANKDIRGLKVQNYLKEKQV